MQRVVASVTASISDLRRSPSAIRQSAKGETVAILNHNRIVAYMVPADLYEAMLDRLDDLALVEIARSRLGEIGVPVDIDAL